MKRINDLQLMIGAIIALAVIAVIITLFGSQEGPPLSIRSTDRDGAMALSLWLGQQGYAVHEMLSSPIQMDQSNVLFILAPLEPYSAEETRTIRDWVRNGHTLIVAGYPYQVNDVLAPYDLVLEEPGDTTSDGYSQAAPAPASPPFEKAKVEPVAYVKAFQPGTVTHLFANGNKPLLASVRFGRGTVWVLAALRPFTNDGIADDANARIVLNMLANVPNGASVAFDEAKHGFGSAPSISAWLFDTPSGWGILLALGLTMLFLALSGRRFGRPVPLPDARLRREPVEYIRAMATLFRRSGQRVEMLKHYRSQLRRRLSERYNVDPRLDDIELVKTIAFRDPAVDEAALRAILARLSLKSISEPELVGVVSDVDNWLRRTA